MDKVKDDKTKSKASNKKAKESNVGETSALLKSKLKEKNVTIEEESPETGKKSKKFGKGKLSLKRKTVDPGVVISTTDTEGKSSVEVERKEVKDVIKVSEPEQETRKPEPNHVHQQKPGEAVKSQVEETLFSLEQYLAAPEISRETEENVLKTQGSVQEDGKLENILHPISQNDPDMDERAGSHPKKSETDFIDFTEDKNEKIEGMLERKREDMDISDLVESITGGSVNKENFPQTEREEN